MKELTDMEELTNSEYECLKAIGESGMQVVPKGEDLIVLCKALCAREYLRPQPMLDGNRPVSEGPKIFVSYSITAAGRNALKARVTAPANP